jgi:hypothetical protein
MAKEAKETPLHPKKVLTFFNYKKIVKDLSEQLLLLGFEYRALSGNNTLPESFKKLNPIPSDAQIVRTTPQPVNGKKKFVIIDQRQVIQQLNERISLLNEAILTLKTNNIADQAPHSLEDPKVLNLSENNVTLFSPTVRLRDAPIDRGRAPLPILPDTDTVADSDNDDNVRYSQTKVFFSGYIWHAARDAIKLLTNDSHLMKMTMPPTSVNLFTCQISDFKFHLFLMMEQVAYQKQNDSYLKTGGMVIFYYNLSNQNESQTSYGITKNHIQSCRDFGIKPLFLIGIAHTNTIDPVALDWFEKFRAEEGLENHCLICDTTELGKEKYFDFIYSLLLEQEKALLLPESENLLNPDEERTETPKRPGCVLQ